MRSRINKRTLYGSYFIFFVNGMVVLMTGAILPYLIKDFHLAYNQGGMLLAIQATANIVAGIASGYVALHFGRKTVLVFGTVCFLSSFAGILAVSSFLGLVLCVFISGVGWGIFTNLVNGLISDAAVENKGILGLLHMFFALGAFSTPFMMSFLIKLDLGWRSAAFILCLLSAVLVFVVSLMTPERQQKTENTEKFSYAFLLNKQFLLFIGILFFYVGTECSFNGWIVTFIINTGVMNDAAAQSTLSLLWIAIITGRFILTFVSGTFAQKHIILVCCTGVIVFTSLFFISRIPVLMAISAAGVGLSLSSIYPAVLSSANFLTNGNSVSNGLMLSFGGFGATVIPYFIGILAQGRGLQAGMSAIVLSALILIVLAVLNNMASTVQFRPVYKQSERV